MAEEKDQWQKLMVTLIASCWIGLAKLDNNGVGSPLCCIKDPREQLSRDRPGREAGNRKGVGIFHKYYE